MDNVITMICPAKINLSLDVLRKREDSYHELKMIMQTIDISDIVTVELKDDNKIDVFCDSSSIPGGEDNIAYKACKVFFKHLKKSYGVCVKIEKHIPAAAGMAGGSTDAAGVLKALNVLTKASFNDEELEIMAKEIGADVPFFIKGGCRLCMGIGEKLSHLPKMKGVYLVIAKPDFSVSTPLVYKNLKLDENTYHPETEMLILMLENENYNDFEKFSGNVLETVTKEKHPEIEEYKKLMKENGAFFSMMTGSGPTVFGLFKNEKDAKEAYNLFINKTKDTFFVKM